MVGRLAHSVVPGKDGAGWNDRRRSYSESEKHRPGRRLPWRHHWLAMGTQSYRSLAYERKGQCLSVLCDLLQANACGLPGLGIRRQKQFSAKCVLYLDLPIGQVSFHSTERFAGPNYPGEWDGENKSEQRILSFCDQLMRSAQTETSEIDWTSFPMRRLVDFLFSLRRTK